MTETMDACSPLDPCFEYDVIGEHLDDPARLLAVDPDGRLVALDLASGQAAPTELSDAWVVDTVAARRARADDRILPPPILVVG
jgi:hypothetical protein